MVPNRQWTKNDVMILLWVTEKYNVLNKKIQEEYVIIIIDSELK